ncbi:hypothetical protein LEL_07844 [Akanthomyces lecanii RCEF 1005]|uniref:Transmembrane protein n=1 Tax=Akanthomyces lecanii RCEF 1005 TaxID=1081108 RepID=A0A168EV19_CORDF|nr:hypothetical protein LEL_07844 [Akanthomyces lecanii RCEF 1005]
MQALTAERVLILPVPRRHSRNIHRHHQPSQAASKDFDTKVFPQIFHFVRLFRIHEDLFAAIHILRAPPSTTRSQLTVAITENRTLLSDPIRAAICFTVKEQLQLSKRLPDAPDSENDESSQIDSINILPRQPLLETLSSTQQILFPLSERHSRHLIQSLIGSVGFDPNAVLYESATVRRRGESTAMCYMCLAERLEDLYEETETPQPDAWLDLALDRKNGRRHVMIITMAGFVVAMLPGVGSLVTGIFQAVVAYLARKHP